VTAVQAICDGLDEGKIHAMAAKWPGILPHPFTAEDTAAGYRYELPVLQAEFSVTRTPDSPVSGRIFFEQVIRDNLDLGRPDRVSLISGRKIIRKGKRATPGRFRTRVITDGVTPSLHVDYKNSKIKQYHKLGKALRTKRPSMRPVTSAWPRGCLICLSSSRSASPPAGACSTSSGSAMTPPAALPS
jgi:hypothetical protein